MEINELDLILKPSKIEGIGVFANRNLPKGIVVLWDKKERKITIKKAKKNRKLYEKCERFGVETEKYYICPKNFLKMSVIWFLNHSIKPNMRGIKKGFISIRKIKKGEELTVDYRKLDKKVDNSNYMGKKF
jgi:SET domain-containing protein